jgi:hypothetical protein
VVASTLLRRYQIELVNVGPETVIDGLTIGDVNWVGADGGAAVQSDGGPGASVQGGIMSLYGASPTIRNCRFIDCSLTAGNGGAGDNGTPPAAGRWRVRWLAYGGADHITQSELIFQNCCLPELLPFGGNGGNGGNGWKRAWRPGRQLDAGRFTPRCRSAERPVVVGRLAVRSV